MMSCIVIANYTEKEAAKKCTRQKAKTFTKQDIYTLTKSVSQFQRFDRLLILVILQKNNWLSHKLKKKKSDYICLGKIFEW